MSALKQPALYLLVGAIVYVVDLACFTAVVVARSEGHLAANALGKLLGAAVGFLLHKHVTFAGVHRDSGTSQAIGYASLLAFNIAFGTLLIYVLVDVMALPTIPVRIAVDVVVIVASFLVSRNRIFRYGTASTAADRTDSKESMTT